MSGIIHIWCLKDFLKQDTALKSSLTRLQSCTIISYFFVHGHLSLRHAFILVNLLHFRVSWIALMAHVQHLLAEAGHQN